VVVRSTARVVRRMMRAAMAPTAAPANERCPVCGRPIRVFRPLMMMIPLQPHPVELIVACRRQNATAHTRAELRGALERRRRAGPKTSSQELAELEEALERHRRPPGPG
jgi:hypothetical protein